MIATNRLAVIGSANASVNSIFAQDAVIITDDPKILSQVRTFIDNIEEITEVDRVFIDNATLEWEIGRAVPIPGTSGRVHNPEADFLPSPLTRMFIKHVVDYEPSPTEQKVIHKQQPRKRATAGPAAKYQLESLRLENPSSIKRGDVIVFVSADNEWNYPPAVAVSEPIRIPRAGGAVLHFLRIRTDLSAPPHRCRESTHRTRAPRVETANRPLRTLP